MSLSLQAQLDYWKREADRLGIELLRALTENARLRDQLSRLRRAGTEGTRQAGVGGPQHMSDILASFGRPRNRG